MECIESKLSSQEIIERISQATGNSSFRITSELSGNIKENRFRVTLPINGFSHPYKPVIYGNIQNCESGSKVEFTIAKPWLANISLAIIAFIFVNEFWLEWQAMATIVGVSCMIIIISRSFRKSEIKDLIKIINNLVQ